MPSILENYQPVFVRKEEDKLKGYIAYTDSSLHLGRNEGAYAFILLLDGQIIDKGVTVFHRETNNRGEMRAVIEALGSCPYGAKVEVRSDSQYAVKVFKGEWSHRSNEDLFLEWKRLVKEKKLWVRMKWVRGHSGDIYNEMCDQMCAEALDQL